MSRNTVLAGIPTTLVLSLILPTSAALALPTLTFENSSVSVEGATPGGEVLFFSVERVPTGFYVEVNIRRESVGADGTGLASVLFDEEVPTRSVWAAIDLATGQFALGSPSSFGLLEEAFAPGAFRTDAAGLADQLRHGHKLVEALWVRPGERAAGAGAWRQRVADGGSRDVDAALDGAVALDPASLQPVGGEQVVPDRFAPGDVVVLIDPSSLEISATQLVAGSGEAGGAR